jgi:hypothetical protein
MLRYQMRLDRNEWDCGSNNNRDKVQNSKKNHMRDNVLNSREKKHMTMRDNRHNMKKVHIIP